MNPHLVATESNGVSVQADKFQQRVSGTQEWSMILELQTGRHTVKRTQCCKDNPSSLWCLKETTSLSLMMVSQYRVLQMTNIQLFGNRYGQEDLSSKRYSGKSWVLYFLKEIFFLHQVSVGILGVIDENQQLYTRDKKHRQEL